MRLLPPRPAISVALALLATTIVAVPPLRGVEPATAAPASARPNVVVILTDDQTLAQLNTMRSTRHLLGDRGLTFSEAIAPYPLCCPSRATLLTGRYATNHGVTTNTTNRHATPELEAAYLGLERASLPISLQDAGYFTGFVGKYLNGYLPDPQTPAGWDDWRAVTYFETYQNTTLSVNGQPVEQPRYMTDVLADETVSMIERASGLDRPFFVQLSTYAPHSVSQGPTWAHRHADLFRGVRAPRTPSFDEADTTDKRRPQPPLVRRTTAQIDRHWRSSLRSLQAVDEAVERIVDALRATGELGSTMIVFTSDNGYFYGEHRFTHEKYLPYEPSIRVPFIVTGPMVPDQDRGETVDLPIAGIDLVPTVLHYARGQMPVTMDGVSLHHVLEGGRPRVWARNRHLLLYGRRTNGCSCAPDYSGVRTTRWMYWTSQYGDELYDLEADPDELVNVADDPDHQPVVQELDAARRALLACAGATCGRPTNWTPWA
jgi:N-acetylglucosamine-6-sulfatase